MPTPNQINAMPSNFTTIKPGNFSFAAPQDGYKRFGGPNDVTVAGLKYYSNPQTYKSNSGLPGEIVGAYPDYNKKSEITEKHFACYYLPDYGGGSANPVSGEAIPPDDRTPFTYLTVPVQGPDMPSGPIDEEDYHQTDLLLYQETAIYVSATIYFHFSPVFTLDAQGNDIVGKGVVFEHYGTIMPRHANQTDPKDKRFTSEFVVIDEADKRVYNTDTEITSPFPNNSGVIATYNPLQYDTGIIHPINFNYELSQFECKLSYNQIINTQITGGFFSFGLPLFIKGKYLLM